MCLTVAKKIWWIYTVTDQLSEQKETNEDVKHGNVWICKLWDEKKQTEP